MVEDLTIWHVDDDEDGGTHKRVEKHVGRFRQVFDDYEVHQLLKDHNLVVRGAIIDGLDGNGAKVAIMLRERNPRVKLIAFSHLPQTFAPWLDKCDEPGKVYSTLRDFVESCRE